ncbi:glycosyltransferase family 4 protein [Nocardioides conyzicola]|uniref:Glycosyltransferase subfamily 4-like N-terminal domain-containing protein n=1 Tax=Nocardioides conyzicola TaxID=1651781 RepID=A0ABP8XLT2_9ACTN
MTRGGGSPLRVLVVTHEASRSGAPRVAEMVVRTLVGEGYAVSVLSCRPGPLLPEFAALAPTAVALLPRLRRRATRLRWGRRVGRGLDAGCAWVDLRRRRPDLVYVNSGAAAAYVRAARWWPRRRTILHVHESAAVLTDLLAGAGVHQLPDDVELVACSPSVHADLMDLAGRDGHEIALLVSVPDEGRVLALGGRDTTERTTDEVVVGCCGSVEHRKGVDLWLRAAGQVLADLPDRSVRFVWVGDGTPPAGQVDPRIEFAGPSDNPYPAMAAFDIATLPSRDDPFPLVVLESMLLGVPVVAFGVGGVPAQIGDAGVVVRPGDVVGFAEAVRALVLDAEARDVLGDRARRRVLAEFSGTGFERALQEVVAR